MSFWRTEIKAPPREVGRGSGGAFAYTKPHVCAAPAPARALQRELCLLYPVHDADVSTDLLLAWVDHCPSDALRLTCISSHRHRHRRYVAAAVLDRQRRAEAHARQGRVLPGLRSGPGYRLLPS